MLIDKNWLQGQVQLKQYLEGKCWLTEIFISFRFRFDWFYVSQKKHVKLHATFG
jgi:hypothetical protein